MADSPPLIFAPRFGAPTFEDAKAAFPWARADTLMRLCQRFASRFDKGEEAACWQWLGPVNKGGYGTFTVGRKPVYATHLALFFAGRPRPNPVSKALHSCDHPSCVNPAHLRWGDAQENADDREARGRSVKPRGERHGHAKLTEDQVRYIRTCGKSLKALKAELGVSATVLSLARAGKTWRHVL